MVLDKEVLHTVKEAAAILGISERMVKHYRKTFTNDVVNISEGRIALTEKFIEKVKNSRKINSNVLIESRTKADLLKEIGELKKANARNDNSDLLKEIAELKEIILDYENSEIYEKANEGFKVEVFSIEEYNVFNERLIQWRLQRQEIEQTKIHFESLKEERDFIKGQLEYFKSSNDKILQQHQNLIDGLRERNRIEAVEKGAIPKEPRDI